MNFIKTIVAAGLVAASTSAFAADITGAGATFPFPIYSKWADAYKKETGNGLNYQSIGSGAGIKQIQAKTVTFGATDAPLKAEVLEKDGLVQWPMVMGAIVPVVNLEGIKPGELVLSGEVLGDIYLGKITKWNDKAIADLNPGVTLPSNAIVPVYRSDSSGTTAIFTSYLSAVSPDWKSKVGSATSVQWPTGAGAKGNEGVTGTVKNTKGGIGYVEFIYAAANKLVVTQLQNKAGKFVTPEVAGFQAAAASADWKGAKDFAASMIDAPAPEAWPIVSPTYILLPKNPTNVEASREVMKFFEWAYTKEGADIAEGLHYIPLPAAVVEQVKAAFKAEVKGPDGKPVL